MLKLMERLRLTSVAFSGDDYRIWLKWPPMDWLLCAGRFQSHCLGALCGDKRPASLTLSSQHTASVAQQSCAQIEEFPCRHDQPCDCARVQQLSAHEQPSNNMSCNPSTHGQPQKNQALPIECKQPYNNKPVCTALTAREQPLLYQSKQAQPSPHEPICNKPVCVHVRQKRTFPSAY